MTTKRDGPGFLGRGWAFPADFDHQGNGPAMVEADEDIVQSLSILFRTRQGERVMRPEYGCALSELVFEPMDVETEVAIERAISRAIMFFEPRIELLDVSAKTDAALEGRLEIKVEYKVRGTNTRHNIVFPYYIREGTLLPQRPLETL